MLKIADANDVEAALLRVLDYTRSVRCPSRSVLASELQGLSLALGETPSSRIVSSMDATRTASGSTYLDALKQAEIQFLGEVAKIVNSRQKYVKAKVAPGVTMAFLEFEGVDTSDMEISGAIGLTHVHYDVTAHVSFESVQRGRQNFDQKLKVGVLTSDLVARMVFDAIHLH